MSKNLKEVSPTPLKLDERPVSYNPRKILGIEVSTTTVVHALFKLQRLSIVPMALYFPVHAVNTMITPLVNPETAPDSFLTAVHKWVPQAASKILIASLLTHIASGVLLRGWKLYKSHVLKEKYHLHHQHKHTTSQDDIGLTGGISGYLFGIYKQFTLSPLSMSGYVLTPLVLYHLLIMKWVPESLGEPATGFDFVKQLLRASEWWIRWFAGIIPLSALISAASYHIVAGACRLLDVKDMKKRKNASRIISGLSIAGFLSILRLSNANSFSSDWSQFKDIFAKLNFLRT